MNTPIINGHLSSYKKKLDLLVFDSTITLVDGYKAWLILHLWVFNHSSYVRNALFDQWFYTYRLKMKPTSEQIYNYNNRSKYFKTDSQSHEPITLQYNLGDVTETVSITSDQEGHIYHKIEIPMTLIETLLSGNQYLHGAMVFREKIFRPRFLVNKVPSTSNSHNSPFPHFPSAIPNNQLPLPNNQLPLPNNQLPLPNNQFPLPINQLIKPIRLLISDIDDTIKYSNVLDKKQLLENTFLNNYIPIPSMGEKYASLVNSGQIDFFYYISSSPWQLWPSLAQQFLREYGFPQSENIALRKLVAKNIHSLLYFLQNSMDYKLETISHVIDEFIKYFPTLEVVLVGDSGEKDPEIYNQIAQKYPNIVKKIIIRNVNCQNLDYTQTFLPDLFSSHHNNALHLRFSQPIWPIVKTYSNGSDFTLDL